MSEVLTDFPVASVELELPPVAPMSRESLEALLLTEGTTAYKAAVEAVAIPNPEQYVLVRTMEDRLLAAAADGEQALDEVQAIQAEDIERLMVGNLVHILERVLEAKRRGHKNGTATLVQWANQKAERWFYANYGNPRRIKKAPVYPKDIVGYEVIAPMLERSRHTGVAGLTKRRSKTGGKKQPTITRPQQEVPTKIGENANQQLFLVALLGAYRKPPRELLVTPQVQTVRSASRLPGSLRFVFGGAQKEKPEFGETASGQLYHKSLLGAYRKPPREGLDQTSKRDEAERKIRKIPGSLVLPFPEAYGQTQDGQVFLKGLLGYEGQPPRQFSQTEGLKDFEARKEVKGQMRIRFPKEDVAVKRTRAVWREELGIVTSGGKEVDPLRNPNPNAVADTAESMRILRWMLKEYRSHPLNEVSIRYARDCKLLVKPSGSLYDPNASLEEVFFDEAGAYPLLDGHVQEVELAEKIRDGIEAQRLIDRSEYTTKVQLAGLHKKVIEGAGAFDTFFQSNLRLVGRVSGRFPTNSRVQRIDHIQNGMEGLRRAIEKFDPTKGFKFSTYAVPWIRQAIGRAKPREMHDVRLTEGIVNAFRVIAADIAGYHAEHGIRPSNDYLITEREHSKKDVEAFNSFYGLQGISLDAPVNQDGDASLMDFVAARTGDKTDEVVYELERSQLSGYVNDTPLSDKERLVLALRWPITVAGIDYDQKGSESSLREVITEARIHGKEVTLDEAAQFIGLTRERCRQIQEQATAKVFLFQGIAVLARRMNFCEEEVSLALDYFSFSGKSKAKERELERTKKADILNLLDILNMCDTNVAAYIDEYVATQLDASDEYGFALRAWLLDRFGLGYQPKYSSASFSNTSSGELVARMAEVYVLARMAGLLDSRSSILSKKYQPTKAR